MTRAVRQNEQLAFGLPLFNGEATSTELTTDCWVGFKMMQNSVPSYKRVIHPLEDTIALYGKG